MNPEAQAVLDRILKLNPEELNPKDRAFLNARRDYLTNDQKRIYASVLQQQVEVLKEQAVLDKKESEVYVSKADQAKKDQTKAAVTPHTYTGDNMSEPKDIS